MYCHNFHVVLSDGDFFFARSSMSCAWVISHMMTMSPNLISLCHSDLFYVFELAQSTLCQSIHEVLDDTSNTSNVLVMPRDSKYIRVHERKYIYGRLYSHHRVKVMLQIWSPVIRVNKSSNTYQRATSHMMNESCHTHEGVTSHLGQTYACSSS